MAQGRRKEAADVEAGSNDEEKSADMMETNTEQMTKVAAAQVDNDADFEMSITCKLCSEHFSDLESFLDHKKGCKSSIGLNELMPNRKAGDSSNADFLGPLGLVRKDALGKPKTQGPRRSLRKRKKKHHEDYEVTPDRNPKRAPISPAAAVHENCDEAASEQTVTVATFEPGQKGLKFTKSDVSITLALEDGTTEDNLAEQVDDKNDGNAEAAPKVEKISAKVSPKARVNRKKKAPVPSEAILNLSEIVSVNVVPNKTLAYMPPTTDLSTEFKYPVVVTPKILTPEIIPADCKDEFISYQVMKLSYFPRSNNLWERGNLLKTKLTSRQLSNKSCLKMFRMRNGIVSSGSSVEIEKDELIALEVGKLPLLNVTAPRNAKGELVNTYTVVFGTKDGKDACMTMKRHAVNRCTLQHSGKDFLKHLVTRELAAGMVDDTDEEKPTETENSQEDDELDKCVIVAGDEAERMIVEEKTTPRRHDSAVVEEPEFEHDPSLYDHLHGEGYLLKACQPISSKLTRKQVKESKYCDWRLLKCNICETQYSCMKTLINHMSTQHSNRKAYFPCIYCPAAYSQAKNVVRHLVKHHKKPQEFVEKLRGFIRSQSFVKCNLTTEKDVDTEFESKLKANLNLHQMPGDTYHTKYSLLSDAEMLAKYGHDPVLSGGKPGRPPKSSNPYLQMDYSCKVCDIKLKSPALVVRHFKLSHEYKQMHINLLKEELHKSVTEISDQEKTRIETEKSEAEERERLDEERRKEEKKKRQEQLMQLLSDEGVSAGAGGIMLNTLDSPISSNPPKVIKFVTRPSNERLGSQINQSSPKSLTSMLKPAAMQHVIVVDSANNTSVQPKNIEILPRPLSPKVMTLESRYHSVTPLKVLSDSSIKIIPGPSSGSYDISNLVKEAAHAVNNLQDVEVIPASAGVPETASPQQVRLMKIDGKKIFYVVDNGETNSEAELVQEEEDNQSKESAT